MSHRKRALCKLSICWRVILMVGMRPERVFPRVRCSVVSIAIVPHDHGSRGGVVLYSYSLDSPIAWYLGALFVMLLVCYGY